MTGLPLFDFDAQTTERAGVDNTARTDNACLTRRYTAMRVF